MNTAASTPSHTIKKVLVVQYSQTGQLAAVTSKIIAPLLADPAISVHVETLTPLRPFRFPWPFFRFLDAFPESAHMRPGPLKPLSLSGDENFDLVILPYQVWFLAPSQPIAAFVKDPVARRVLKGKPVVTVIACRNMWLMAQEKMKALLADAGAHVIDNVTLTDAGSTLATLITTPRWMLSGKRNGFWGLPAAGLTDQQIQGTQRFGLALRDALHSDREKGSGPLLSGLAASVVNPRVYISERAATRGFFVWGKLLMAVGKPGSWQRVPVLALYAVFLVVMIVTVVPTSLMLQSLLRPLMRHWLSTIKTTFEQPSGSATDRMPYP